MSNVSQFVHLSDNDDVSVDVNRASQYNGITVKIETSSNDEFYLMFKNHEQARKFMDNLSMKMRVHAGISG